MKRIVILLAILAATAIDATAQTDADRRYLDSLREAAPKSPRPYVSVHADVTSMLGNMGRGETGSVSAGVGVRIGKVVCEVHQGSIFGAATTDETLVLGGVSIPITSALSFEVMCGGSMMNGYSEGRHLYTERVSDFEMFLIEFMTLGYADGDRTRKHYEHHGLGTGPAMRIALTGIAWNWTRLGLIVAGRTEFKENTTQIAVGLSVQAGTF